MSKYFILYILIGLNVLVFILPYLLGAGDPAAYQNYLILQYGKVNSAIEAGEYYRLLTSTFLHGGILHLVLNMYSLYVLGQVLLERIASWKFLFVYLVAGVFGSIFSFLLNNSISIGASGAVFGLVGLIMAIGIKDRNRPLVNSVWQIVLINVAFGLLNYQTIDNWAHLGGFISGILLGFVLSTGQKYARVGG